MPLFQTQVQIDLVQINQILMKYWNIQIANLVQTSQNRTYVGYRQNSEKSLDKFFIRVSPDPQNKNQQKIKDEVFFVNYLKKHNLNNICSFEPKTYKQAEEPFVHFQDKFNVVVITPVNGLPLPFHEFQWMLNKQVVFLWGKFFAEMHNISKKFQKDHPEVAKRIQSWREIHNGTMSDVKLDQLDEKDVQNPQHYGVLHGDLNISNFYFDKQNKVMNVFDTDQVQRGFYLWDLSRAVFTSYMLENAGMPNSGNPVPEANYKQFKQWIVEGYQSVTGKGSVDQDRLQRMILLNRHFYIAFCNKAVQEGSIPEDMRPFVEYVAKYLTIKE